MRFLYRRCSIAASPENAAAMRKNNLVLMAIAMVAFAGATCTSSGTESDAVPLILLGEDATMAPGDRIIVGDPALLLTFVGVTSDSRCPTSVVCVQAGSARVALRASATSGDRDVFVETATAKDTASIDSYRVTLRSVAPTLTTTLPVPAASYRATLRVTRK